MIQRHSLISTAALALLAVTLSAGCNKQPPGRTISAPTPGGGEPPAVEAPADTTGPAQPGSESPTTKESVEPGSGGVTDKGVATTRDADATPADTTGEGVESPQLVEGQKSDSSAGPVVVVEGKEAPRESDPTDSPEAPDSPPMSPSGNSDSGSAEGEDVGASGSGESTRPAGQGVTLTVGQVSGAGVTVVPIYIAGAGAASLQFQLIYDPTQIEITSVVAGPAATSAAKQVNQRSFGDQGVMRVLVLGMNQNLISDGTLVNVTVRPKVEGQVAPIAIGSMSAAAPDASAVGVAGVAGQFTIH